MQIENSIILRFFIDKHEDASHVAEIVSVFVVVFITAIANHARFWFRWFRSGNFHLKNALRHRIVRAGTSIYRIILALEETWRIDKKLSSGEDYENDLEFLANRTRAANG